MNKQLYCNILTHDPAVNQETGASGRRYWGITLTCGRVEFAAIARLTGSGWSSNSYITRCQRRLGLVGISWLQFELQFEAVRTSSRQRACGPQWPPVEHPAEWEGIAAIARGTWDQYVAVCSVSNSPLSHNPFENKVWEVHFSKEVCSFVIIFDYVSAYICYTSIRLILNCFRY